MSDDFKSGFVAVVGRPNVGKSTLVNRMVGSRVSITSPKPETTRRRILGVVHGDNYQIVLVDTPGLAAAKSSLGRRLRETAIGESQEADMVLFVVDITAKPHREDRAVATLLESVTSPIFLLCNQIDKFHRPEEQLGSLQRYSELGNFVEVIPVSATTGANVDRLQALMVDRLQPGVPYFPKDMQHDLDVAAIVEEIVRGEVMNVTYQEVPHAVAVKVDSIEPGDNPGVEVIRATIYVERENQKQIVIGRKGQKLKEIGQHARVKLEEQTGKRIFLELWVKVKADWRDRDDWVKYLVGQ
jgi:GTP-binding protein Era